jgi:hypothetical protein
MITDPVIIDSLRSVGLANTDYTAATVVDTDGAEHLMLVRSGQLGRPMLLNPSVLVECLTLPGKYMYVDGLING